MYPFYKFKKAKIDKNINFKSFSSLVNFFSGLETLKKILVFRLDMVAQTCTSSMQDGKAGGL